MTPDQLFRRYQGEDQVSYWHNEKRKATERGNTQQMGFCQQRLQESMTLLLKQENKSKLPFWHWKRWI